MSNAAKEIQGVATAERHEVVVIGAGQAGLATGYHLSRRGIDHVILERSPRVGEVWRRRYDSLRLYSPAGGDSLPGLPFPLAARSFPTGRQMGDYLEQYASHHHLPVRTGTSVTRLRTADPEDGATFEVTAGEARMLADQVVVANGGFGVARVPGFAANLDPGIRQLHAADYHSPAQLAPGAVLVVGLSHSGADLALEIAQAGHRTIVSGRAHGELPFAIDSWRGRHLAWPMMRFLGSRLLTLGTPIGRKMAPMVRKGGGPLLRVRSRDLRAAGVELHEARTVGARDGKPLLADGTTVDVSNVLWCTGYSADYSWIDLPMELDQGWPKQYRGVVESVPGLYIMGIPFLYAFASMLVAGAGRDARYISDRVADRLGPAERSPAAA